MAVEVNPDVKRPQSTGAVPYQAPGTTVAATSGVVVRVPTPGPVTITNDLTGKLPEAAPAVEDAAEVSEAEKETKVVTPPKKRAAKKSSVPVETKG